MSSVVFLESEAAAVARAEDYLGPATVVETGSPEVKVELPDGGVRAARPAFVVPYEPAAGDVLLVIAKGASCYAIGVLHGTGKTVLAMPGDVEVRAEGGTLRFFGEKGIDLVGPEVSVQAEKLRMVAGSVTQKFTSLVQRVRGLLSVQAKEVHTVAEEAHVTHAKSAAVLTEETMTINGKQIHLG